ncbi:hypothetical protein E1B28_011865 [Marasmius oreades]|uniref:Uncharacterized protein n=1 Tax=Marasmius oreades TaxID=181124 RepID=A0A9P7RWF7_9AGAR|nr:uncharacterized protein E1B28_011865 [Marasmius oreades]KAG7090268.1 hypothetical protein E1B28_011865 [Marasmius oreades]
MDGTSFDIVHVAGIREATASVSSLSKVTSEGHPIAHPSSVLPQPETTSSLDSSLQFELASFPSASPQPESAFFLDSPPQPQFTSSSESLQLQSASSSKSPQLQSTPSSESLPIDETTSFSNSPSLSTTGRMLTSTSTQLVASNTNSISNSPEASTSTELNNIEMAPPPSSSKEGSSRAEKIKPKPYKASRPIIRGMKNPNKVLKCGTTGTPINLCKAFYIEYYGPDATQGAFYKWLANIDQDLWESFVKKAKKTT